MSDMPYSGCPEELGIPSGAVCAMIDAWEKTGGLHSFMLLRHGKIAAEGWWKPYSPEKPHMLFSLSKSFTAIAALFAENEGLLDFDLPVLSFFPEFNDIVRSPCENIKKMRVRHLLSMCTGHMPNADFIFEYDDCVAAFLTSKAETAPGSRFSYNTGATYMVSAIISKITGMKLNDYLKPRLFIPLGIKEVYWEECARGISYGGFGLNLKTEDIAKFGQFLLNRGIWNGVRLLPAESIDLAAMKHINNSGNTKYPCLDAFVTEDLPDADRKNDWAQGYGHQFWRCLPEGVYRGDGAFGQLCIVMPQYDAVLAVTAGTGDMQAELNAVWDNLLPAFKSGPLLCDETSYELLRVKLSSLTIPLPGGTGPVGSFFARTYQLTENSFGFKTICFEKCENGDIIYITGNDRKQRIYKMNQGEWTDYQADANRGQVSDSLTSKLSPASENDGHSLFFSLSGTSGQNYYNLTVVQNRTPFVASIIFTFEDDRLYAEGHYNVGFSSCDIKFGGCAVVPNEV